jgi:hypothetical protein
MQVYRGIGSDGDFIGDLIGLEEESISIPGATSVDRLLEPFWENGHHEAIPSITKQKAFVEAQRSRFKDIESYPCELSDGLRALCETVTSAMREDRSGWREVVTITPELVKEAGALE